MQVTLYKCSAERSRLDKSGFLSDALSVPATIKGIFSVQQPELVLHYPGDLSGYNYIQCTFDDVNHYYWCRISGDIGQQLRAACKRDPLYTFAAQIKAHPIRVTRCSKQAPLMLEPDGDPPQGYNSMLPDNEITVSSMRYYKNIPFTIGDQPAKFAYPDYDNPSTSQYVLAVVG